MMEWFFSQESVKTFGTDCLRLFVAVLLGGSLGIERQLRGQWAGVRTHMMVSLGAAIFTIAAVTTAPNNSNDVTRVIQGIAAGIGFLGAGTILKLGNEVKIKGLTTASSIWLAAALGTVSGMGEYALAAAAGVISLWILASRSLITKAFGNGDAIEKETSDVYERI